MANNIDIFDWRSLTAAVSKIAPTTTFLMDTIFKASQSHMADTVDIEVIKGQQKLARFVNKDEGPQLVGKTTRQLLTFSLPRIFETKVFTATELATFKTGEAVYAGSAQDVISQAETYKLQEIALLKDRITRRMEQMAASILTTGGLTISQGNIDATYSFDYHASGGTDINQLVTLSGTSRWGESAADILGNIRAWRRAIFKKTGANATIGLLGTDAAGKFIADSTIANLLNNWNKKTGVMDLTQPIVNGANYLGRVLGVDFYEYSCPYINDAGSAAEAFDTKTCVLVAPDDSFRKHYGPIYRLQDGGGRLTIQNEIVLMPVLDRYQTALEWTIESKPLPAVHNPDRVVSATVMS